jgi:glutaredoxin
MPCRRVKEFLSRMGVGFEARDVEEDARAYDELLALGVRTVPATVVGGRVITGFDEAALRAALSEAVTDSADR